MLFEIIDQKGNCKSIVLNNEIVSTPEYDKLTKTWSYHSSLKEYDIEYAYLYSQGKSLNDCCPDVLKNEWELIKQKHLAYINSFKNGFCELNDHCFYDLVPKSFVIDYFKTKNEITNHVLHTYTKPENYDFLVELLKLTTSIRDQNLNINPNVLTNQLHQLKVRSFYSKLFSCNSYIDYNIFGTITGRLATKKDSFPILTMNKDYRSVIEPANEWYVELDFNAAELRCLLALNEQKQPTNDVHDWHGAVFAKLLDQQMSRDDIKRKIFGWLYGPANVSLGIPEIERCYDKQNALKKYWNGTEVKNPFNRIIKADEFHALNALIQSTTSDMFLRRAIAVNKLLEGKKSFTMGLIHDSIVIDFAREDKALLPELIKVFGETNLGDFKVNTRVGTTFGNMKRMR